ncbi:MAG: ThuA domain-containing protein [Planctomycetes bacterium]|nr:ThuA domain-containing protein [Planctomycetota bacterium]
MDRIPTLLLTGVNNHDWERSAPFVRDLLERSGRFAVTLTESPSAALENAAELSKYRLLFMDYNGPAWSDAARANFEKAVAGGTGLVVLHAADNAFPGWTEFEKMAALLWRDGTGHGEFHEFNVAIKDKNHPITRGLNDYAQWDELYHRLVHMHHAPVHVLATAHSSADKGGTGAAEPVAVVIPYGKGRVYHHILGHVWKGDPLGAYKGASMIAFENPTFQRLLLRGSEWAATGAVTLS